MLWSTSRASPEWLRHPLFSNGYTLGYRNIRCVGMLRIMQTQKTRHEAGSCYDEKVSGNRCYSRNTGSCPSFARFLFTRSW